MTRGSAGLRAAEAVRVHIRWMIRRDMVDVLAIERQSFDFSWTEDEFLQCLRQRNCIGMVAEHRDRVVGFMIYELQKNRLNVLNFAVATTARRMGIGSQMVEKLIGKLHSHRRRKITVAVRERNLDAQLFFKALDFRATKVIRKFYEDSGEDAFQMELRAARMDEEEVIETLAKPKAHNRLSQFEEK